MEARSLKFVAEACEGELRGGPDAARPMRPCTDSRQAQAGDLFFAIKGERFDGHDFVAEAAKQGAAAVVIKRDRIPLKPLPCPLIAVDEPRAALGRLAAAYRKQFRLPIIAVGGSNGKTTTKELIAAVLRRKLSVLWSQASFNNNLGVPLSLLRLEASSQAAVLEAGTNHPGELAPLLAMIKPGFGVITNIGREHLEFFGNLAGVAREEGTLAESLPRDGALFVNGDCEWSRSLAERSPARVVRVGLDDHNHWRARNIRPDARGTIFEIEAPKAEFNGEYRINLLGRHQVINALFAAAVGEELGLGRPALRDGLAECKPPAMRLELREIGGILVLDDSYNANGDSMLAALQTLKELPCKGRRVAVLGDMAELGEQSEAAHAEVGRKAAESGLGQLFAVGKWSRVMAQSAREAGLNRAMEFEDAEAAGAALRTFLKKDDIVLLKASRAARLERIAEALQGGAAWKKS